MTESSRMPKAKQPPADRQQRCLKQGVARDVAAAGPEGLPDGELLGAAACADQEQVDKVDSADEEQEQHGALQKQENRANLAHVVLMQEAYARVEAGSDDQLGKGVVFDLLGIEGVNLRLRDGKGGPWSQARDQVAVVGMAPVRPPFVFVRGVRDVELGLAR